MTQESKLFPLTIEITADILADRCVSQQGVYATAAGSCFGVSTRDASIGEYTAVSTLGTKIVTAGAAIAFDDYVEVGDDGKVVSYSSGVKVGRCMQSATADGDKIEIFQLPN